MSDATEVLTRLREALSRSYRVERELGQGGMATVYLAHDLKHEREVAIKVLHPDLGAALGGERFLAEIKTTAKLQHPHILPLLDSGAADGLLYYVMPFVRGETLRARLERERQLPIPDALRIAREVASALDNAHKQGIIHRDIKPENILLQDGAAVVADFGIALAVQQAGGQRMTQTGLSLGTPQYMSPEQAMGERSIDARSDIYALGAVTYEMLAGEPPFSGPSTQAIVAKVLSEKPVPLTTVRDTVPGSVNAAVAAALAKLPADRPASGGQYAALLDVPASTHTGESGYSPVHTSSRRYSKARTWSLVVGVALAAGAGGYAFARRVDDTPDAFTRVQRLTDDEGVEDTPAVSPDGQTIAYARERRGSRDIFVRRVGGRNTTVIAGDSTVDEIFPAFSPDGQRIAYSRPDGIWVVESTGENARKVAPRGSAPTWSPDGESIVYETESSIDPTSLGAVGALERVDLRTGAVRRLESGGDPVYRPAWSPSGERLAVFVFRDSRRDIETIPAGGGLPVRVTDDAAMDISPEWSPDGRFLYFASDRGGSMAIWRVAIEERTGAMRGNPTLVSAGAEAEFDTPKFARSGARLIFRTVSDVYNPAVADLDIANRRLSNARRVTNRTLRLVASDVSPDGTQLALQGDSPSDLWVIDTSGENLRQLTNDAYLDRRPRFAADGRVVWYSNRGGRIQVYRMNVDGSGVEPLTRSSGMPIYPILARDGRTLIVADSGFTTAEASAPWPANDAAIQHPLGASVAGMPITPLALSPDERLVAGHSRRSDRRPSGVAVYDRVTQRAWHLDDAGPTPWPAWLPDSRSVIVIGPRGGLALVDAMTGRGSALAGTPSNFTSGSFLVVSPDGKRLYYTDRQRNVNIWMMERPESR